MKFKQKLLSAARQNRSWLCIGLDPDPEKIPQGYDTLDFCRRIIDKTHDLVCAYKPNVAFFETLGGDAWPTLKGVIDYIPDGIPVILDAKRGDIGNTASAYARSVFDILGADAVTVNPYMGRDSVQPFLDYSDRGVFVLCRTSNPGSSDFQLLTCEGRPLYRIVAEKALGWSHSGNLGLVVGATQPGELGIIRQLYPDIPLLIPGIGSQGGDLAETVRNGADPRGEMAIINSSRQIIYASSGNDFAVAARQSAINIRDEIAKITGG